LPAFLHQGEFYGNKKENSQEEIKTESEEAWKEMLLLLNPDLEFSF